MLGWGDAYRRSPEAIAPQQVEGFVRQIVGWREHVRCVHWHLMPGFAEMNFFNHAAPGASKSGGQGVAPAGWALNRRPEGMNER